MAKLVFVGIDDLPYWYPKAKPFLASMVERSRGRLSHETVKAALDAGDYWLCLAVEDDIKAVLVAHPVHWKTGLKEMEIIALMGVDLDTWLDLEPELRERMHGLGYSVVTPIARPGWARLMKSRGYRTTHVIMERWNA